MMEHFSVSYEIEKDGVVKHFNKEKDACDFLGVAQCTISSCYRRGLKCKGWTIKRGHITTHNATKTRLFRIWSGMKERCYRKNHQHYNSYGGRGIKICDEWMNFKTFQNWASLNGYDDNLTIERINVNGNYEPNNCKWTTQKEQHNNTRRNHYIEIKGERLTITQCSEKYYIPRSTIAWRIKHNRDILTGARMDGEENESS